MNAVSKYVTLCVLALCFCLIGTSGQQLSAAENEEESSQKQRELTQSKLRLWLQKVGKATNDKFWQGVNISKRSLNFARSKARAGWSFTRTKVYDLWKRLNEWRKKRRAAGQEEFWVEISAPMPLVVTTQQPQEWHEAQQQKPAQQVLSPKSLAVAVTSAASSSAAARQPISAQQERCLFCNQPIILDEQLNIKNMDQLLQLWASDAPFENEEFKKLYINIKGNKHLSCVAQKVVEGQKFGENETLIAKHYLDIVGPVWLPKPYNPDWIEAFSGTAGFNYQREIAARNKEQDESCRKNVRVGYLIEHEMGHKLGFTQATVSDEATAWAVARSLDTDLQMQLFNRISEALEPNFRGDSKNFIRFCDQKNKDSVFQGEVIFQRAGKEIKISQLPALYQFYPKLSDVYGPNFNAMCGYYAAFFALIMLVMRSVEDMTRTINNRDVFENGLKEWMAAVNIKRQAVVQAGDLEIRMEVTQFGLSMLGADEIKGITNEANVFIEGHDGDQQKIQKIQNFISQKDARPLCFIVCPERGVAHWICVLAWRNPATQQIELIIADSAGKDRRNIEPVRDIARNISKASK